MSYVIAATYVAKPGEGDGILDALQAMLTPTRAEPGCIVYRAHRSVEDPDVFFLYEEYVDATAFEAHGRSAHFEKHIKQQAWPRLVTRTVVRAEPLD